MPSLLFVSRPNPIINTEMLNKYICWARKDTHFSYVNTNQLIKFRFLFTEFHFKWFRVHRLYAYCKQITFFLNTKMRRQRNLFPTIITKITNKSDSIFDRESWLAHDLTSEKNWLQIRYDSVCIHVQRVHFSLVNSNFNYYHDFSFQKSFFFSIEYFQTSACTWAEF